MTTTLCTVNIYSRDYSSYKYNIDIDIEPSIYRLFNDDQFILETKEIVSSPVRESTNIAGILVLEGNKTFGRATNGKLLYRCIPDDTSLPIFLIPYEIKNMNFSKVFSNQYILFKFSEWTDKHPIGIITETIGSVDNKENFYIYQLHCKKLWIPINLFKNATDRALKLYSYENYIEQIKNKYAIEERMDKVFSIDPLGSLDFDDAMSIVKLEDGFRLSIYISNVSIWLDILDLWEYFSERVSTIYMPDKKYPMLPPILSDNICSLKSNQKSVAFTMDIYMDRNYNTIDVKYTNTIINLYRNYCYEEPDLLKDPNYILIKKICELQKSIPSININDSHDLVSYLMITMNHYTSTVLLKYNNGIFRVAKKNTDMEIDDIDITIKNFISIYKSTAGEYIDIERNMTNIKHEMLGLDSYIHMTSPIRRLVDLLNMIQFQENTNMLMKSTNNRMMCFYKKWIKSIDKINCMMRRIKRVQSDGMLLHLISTTKEKVYNGYKIDCSTVYIPDLKTTFYVVLNEEYQLYKMYRFKLYLFKNEDKLKNKIRLSIE